MADKPADRTALKARIEEVRGRIIDRWRGVAAACYGTQRDKAFQLALDDLSECEDVLQEAQVALLAAETGTGPTVGEVQAQLQTCQLERDEWYKLYLLEKSRNAAKM